MDILTDSEENVSVANNKSVGVSGWQGMTIKEILEKNDLLNFTTLVDDDNEKLGDTKEALMMLDSKDAKPKTIISASQPVFLGPKIWENLITVNQLTGIGGGKPENNGIIDAAGAEFSVMDFDEFLNENSLGFGRISPPLAEGIFDDKTRVQEKDAPTKNVDVCRTGENSQSSVISDDSMIDSQPPISSAIALELPQLPTNEFVVQLNIVETSPQSSAPSNKSKNTLPKGGNEFLYVESKSARIERENEERRLKEEAIIKFSAEELSLATIPGVDFDPTHRQFSLDELRPQPIIRKGKKTYVKIENKNGQYWDKRHKNNIAARRSREARRLKENQISLRTAFLEQQNASLNAALKTVIEKNEKLTLENKLLVENLQKYASMASFLD